MPVVRGKKLVVTAGSKMPKLNATTRENQMEGPQVKRASSPPHGAPKKRTAFIDITNAHKVTISLPGRKKKNTVKKQAKKTSATSVSTESHANLEKSSSMSSEGTPAVTEEQTSKDEEQGAAAPVEELEAAAPPAAPEVPAHLLKQQIPVEFDIDSENSEDCYMCPEYAKDIFDYLKKREEKFVLCNYMPSQPTLNPEMRAILIDWLVEVQENFELYHETLYLAVKMADHYLSKTPVHRELLQLVGSTTMLIASKFEGGGGNLPLRPGRRDSLPPPGHFLPPPVSSGKTEHPTRPLSAAEEPAEVGQPVPMNAETEEGQMCQKN
ncbi:G2/mitotic-specific cyclin-B3-like [Notothenia coriiceps]|uniref:G2/mitotic-specific cyclin-B2 n=1 Tax=Notothenia coriiceps TaxID=8208 RepID=A0A6I9PWU2_9TELE|nr:PREDICTED: G2/mitotic-specific cyclin-B3-like [Notothenia coriiceps]